MLCSSLYLMNLPSYLLSQKLGDPCIYRHFVFFGLDIKNENEEIICFLFLMQAADRRKKE